MPCKRWFCVALSNVDNVIALFGLTYCSFGTHYRLTEKPAECHDNGVPDAAIIGCRMKKFSGAESGKIMHMMAIQPFHVQGQAI